MNTFTDIGEHAAIQRLFPFLNSHPKLAVGAGDDCAVVRASETEDWVLTTDPLVEGIHFELHTAPARIGHKAVARVLSDLAAMGAQPLFLLINVVAPAHYSVSDVEKMYAAARDLALKFDASIIGGDLAQGDQFQLHIFGVGSLPRDTALLRSTAQVGDKLFVTGPLGGSFASGHHLDFMPRVAEGIALRNAGVHAVMDLSDGIGTDLRHLCAQSKVGALLTELPCNSGCSQQQALFDGEDFELLFSAPGTPSVDFPVYLIGEIVAESEGIGYLNAQQELRSLGKKGFEHFA